DVRRNFPDSIIIAGNVATREMTEALILAGADVVKVGIGPGSVCTNRKVAGVGYPQLSAISECADAAHGLGGHVMADGGCSSPGDIAKAFAAGADFVMLGGMLAGHDESGGELVEGDNGKMYKSFYGMSSAKAMQEYYGEIAKHRAPEGKEVRVPYRGSLEETVQSILGGVRSACSYVGARRIKDLPKCTTFIRVTRTTNEVYRKFNVEE
ncbi:MAG: IMP dehydrogenase, partial [Candidatus Thermoplasmatota archaeon]|nr:IMP dehydrogenase [Candidatus Thermoplasmatota archaeon]